MFLDIIVFILRLVYSMIAELVQGTTSLRVISNQIKKSSGEENLASSLTFTPS